MPNPEPGLVIRYSCLWAGEHEDGHEEGRKDRPCATVLAVTTEGDAVRAIVVAATHVPPIDSRDAIEIPSGIKTTLRLNQDRSWIVVALSNDIVWPRPDLRRIGQPTSGPFADGHLPSRFFPKVRRQFGEMERARRGRWVPRTE